MLSEKGCLCLLDKPGEAAANAEHLRLLEQTGFAFETLTPQQVAEREPALNPRLSQVLRFPSNRSISDPHGLVSALVEAFCGLGGTLVHGCVDHISRREGGVEAVHLSDGRSIQAAQIVLCAGIQSAALSRSLGEPIPLESERGYHSQIMAPGVKLNHALIWPARAFMVTPTAGGLRVGGTVELGGLNASPDYRRAKILVRHAQEVVPALKAEQVSEWMGHRPATPDTIPVIGRSAKTRGLLYATGHGHLGLTNAATTAQIIAALIDDRPPPLDISPYRVDRF
jgi:D-amino-acid dehydrogenase